MSRVPIRLRLTLAFAAAVAVVLALFGFVVYGAFEDRLLDNVDQSLRSRAADIAALVERSGPELPDSASDELVETEESFAQLLGPGGQVVDGTARLRTEPLLDEGEAAGVGDEEGTLFDRDEGPVEADDPVRLLAVPVEADGARYTLVVGQAMDDNEESLGTLRLLLLAGLPVALLLASLAGYTVAASALRPVEAMRRKAAAISDDSPGDRLPVPAARDEISRLGETLNAMLARLEAAIEHERGFVADASHELRTPVAILKTELELALREQRSEEELREALRSGLQETERLARLADDLLALARADRGTLPLDVERLSVRELAAGAADRFRRTGHDVAVAVPEGLELVGDRLRLEQALGNLLANAAVHGKEPVRLRAEAHDGAIELHVEDAGPGLPPDFAGRAFERFARADSARTGGGAGLGLAIVDAVARAHGGSAGARGADFWISLPALTEDSSGGRTTAA